VDDGEAKTRRAQGYSTVSHFNVIHIECHLAAVRRVALDTLAVRYTIPLFGFSVLFVDFDDNFQISEAENLFFSLAFDDSIHV